MVILERSSFIRILTVDSRVLSCPPVLLTEPDQFQGLHNKMALLCFAVGGRPLDPFRGIAWDTYCPFASLEKFPNQRVTVCGLIIVDRSHHQITGDQMKFITLCDHAGIIEGELFADTYP